MELGDIDEALRHLALVPEQKRDAAWYAYVDKCLDLRNTTGSLHEPRRDLRVSR